LTDIQIVTDHLIALDSPDHLWPHGTKNDNNTNVKFIAEIEERFRKKISFLDLGCAGGQLAIDMHSRGHTSVGLEGSDYCVKNKRLNWVNYYQKVLFTCDISKCFRIMSDNHLLRFDCITAWEVLEHIHPERLATFLDNVGKHLKFNGIFLGSVCSRSDVVNGHELHLAVFSENHWKKKILGKYFITYDYPLRNSVRNSGNQLFCARKV